MSLVDVLKPAPPITDATRGRVHRLSNQAPKPQPTATRVHRIAAPEEDDDLQPGDALPPRPASFPAVAREIQTEQSPQEENMPRGVYPRKKKGEGGTSAASAEPTDKPGGKRRGRKKAVTVKVRAARAPRPPVGAARFGVFDDGSVQISTAECSGRLGAEEARGLVEFITRLQARPA